LIIVDGSIRERKPPNRPLKNPPLDAAART